MLRVRDSQKLRDLSAYSAKVDTGFANGARAFDGAEQQNPTSPR
jgi:hypothetical protein